MVIDQEDPYLQLAQRVNESLDLTVSSSCVFLIIFGFFFFTPSLHPHPPWFVWYNSMRSMGALEGQKRAFGSCSSVFVTFLKHGLWLNPELGW